MATSPPPAPRLPYYHLPLTCTPPAHMRHHYTTHTATHCATHTPCLCLPPGFLPPVSATTCPAWLRAADAVHAKQRRQRTDGGRCCSSGAVSLNVAGRATFADGRCRGRTPTFLWSLIPGSYTWTFHVHHYLTTFCTSFLLHTRHTPADIHYYSSHHRRVVSFYLLIFSHPLPWQATAATFHALFPLSRHQQYPPPDTAHGAFWLSVPYARPSPCTCPQNIIPPSRACGAPLTHFLLAAAAWRTLYAFVQRKHACVSTSTPPADTVMPHLLHGAEHDGRWHSQNSQLRDVRVLLHTRHGAGGTPLVFCRPAV